MRISKVIYSFGDVGILEVNQGVLGMAFQLPSVGNNVIIDDKVYRVTNVTWNIDTKTVIVDIL